MEADDIQPRLRLQLWRCAPVLLIIFTLFVASGCGLLFVMLNGLDAPSFETGAKRADEVIIALERHRQGWGKHPQQLKGLIPDFLDEIPKAGWRYDFRYEICRNDIGYILYFPTKNDGYCGFNSKLKAWQCVYSDSTSPMYLFESACTDLPTQKAEHP